MAELNNIFIRIEEILKSNNDNDFFSNFVKNTNTAKQNNEDTYNMLKNFLHSIIKNIDEMATIINSTENVLISVKNQKALRTCFQIISSLGISNCLIPGLGLNLSKRCVTAKALPKIELNDDEKYDFLVFCTEFFHRSYKIPVLKNIILTFHLTDYLAALIQLAYAPLKKPGIYKNFTMTEEKYCKLNTERQKYISMYEHLVNNCFQPILMKELLVLQNVKDVEPPAFVKRIIAKEMSRQLIASGGLLSLIRCFIESYDMDTGVDWNKIHMISKIVSNKHGNITENEYLNNICNQLKQILNLNNKHYLTTAVSCLLSLSNKYPASETVKSLLKESLQPFNYECLMEINKNPGTIILTAQEVEHKISTLHTCSFITKDELPTTILSSNLYILFLLVMKCSNIGTKKKVYDIIFKIFELEEKENILKVLSKLFNNHQNQSYVLVEEYESGLVLKCSSNSSNHSVQDVTSLLLFLFENNSNIHITEYLFEYLLQMYLDQNSIRQNKIRNETLLTLEDDPVLLCEDDEKYATIIILLSEISTTPKVINIMRTKPSIVINFVEKLLITNTKENDECITIALALLNSVLVNNNKSQNLRNGLTNLLPILHKISKSNSQNKQLCQEILSLINSGYHQEKESPYSKALANVFDSLLPVRAHGIMEITKLIDAADTETLSKRHYVFCLLQEQLKDSDSYVYLATINGIASLATLCTEEVLSVLCKEYLHVSSQKIEETLQDQNKIAELRMKIGDIVVKVVRRLGEMAIVHKSILLNTFLCGCRDEDPLIRASSLSNLAEIALVLHYRVGTIIYEILLCIWSIIETDKAIECRRAAVMVITSLIKGLGKDTLIELKENLLPIYRTLNSLYKNDNEDSIVRLHAQIALEELNDIVKEFLFAELPMDKKFRLMDDSSEIRFK